MPIQNPQCTVYFIVSKTKTINFVLSCTYSRMFIYTFKVCLINEAKNKINRLYSMVNLTVIQMQKSKCNKMKILFVKFM